MRNEEDMMEQNLVAPTMDASDSADYVTDKVCSPHRCFACHHPPS